MSAAKSNKALGYRCSKCGQASDAESCPVCGNQMPDSDEVRNKVNQAFKYYLLPSMVGLFGVLIATHFYPPLDKNALIGFGLVPFFAPIFAHLAFSIRRQLSSHVEMLKGIYRLTAVVLAIFAAFLFLNGAMDKYPSEQAETRVTQKLIARGKYGQSYSLIVTPSWRSGRLEERLEVDGPTYSMVRTGDPVRVVLHRGAFRLPWFSGVLPEYYWPRAKPR